MVIEKKMLSCSKSLAAIILFLAFHHTSARCNAMPIIPFTYFNENKQSLEFQFSNNINPIKKALKNSSSSKDRQSKQIDGMQDVRIRVEGANTHGGSPNHQRPIHLFSITNLRYAITEFSIFIFTVSAKK